MGFIADLILVLLEVIFGRHRIDQERNWRAILAILMAITMAVIAFAIFVVLEIQIVPPYPSTEENLAFLFIWLPVLFFVTVVAIALFYYRYYFMDYSDPPRMVRERAYFWLSIIEIPLIVAGTMILLQWIVLSS